MIAVSVSLGGALRIRHLTRQDRAAIAREAAVGVRVAVEASLAHMGQVQDSRHFWSEAQASLTHPTVRDGKATIEITGPVGVRLQWLGGTVRPTGKPSRVTGRPTRALLIPLPGSPLRRSSLAEQSANLASDEEIRVLKSTSSGAPYLARIKPYKRRVDGRAAKVTPLGILRASATIPPHPDVMPTDNDLWVASRDAAVTYLRVHRLITPSS